MGFIPYTSLYSITLISMLRMGLVAQQKERAYRQFISLPLYEDMAPWNIVFQVGWACGGKSKQEAGSRKQAPGSRKEEGGSRKQEGGRKVGWRGGHRMELCRDGHRRLRNGMCGGVLMVRGVFLEMLECGLLLA